MAEEEPKLDAAREQRGIYCFPHDLDHEDIVNNATRNVENKEGLRDAVQNYHTSPPEQSKLGATVCKWTV